MTDQTYIEPVASRPDDHTVPLPLADSSGPTPSPVTSAYPHLSYTATAQVPQFAYQSSSDPLLLTPISLAGSPPMPQAAKFIHYSSPPAASSPQQLTPPTTSLMYWSSTFDLSAPPGSAESPMEPEQSSTSATPSHFDMAYVAADNATEDIPDHIPEPPHSPYYGGFAVSGSCNADPDDRVQYFSMPNPGPSPLFIDQHSGEQVQQPQETAIRTPLRQDAPTLPSANLAVFQQPNDFHFETPKPPGGSPSEVSPNEVTARARGNRPCRVNKRAKLRARPHKNGDNNSTKSIPEDTIQFRPGVPDEERFLLEQRIRFHNLKGKTMWDAISTEFTKRFNKTPDKAALQMKLTRARQKYIVWSKKDEEILQKVFYEDEKNRYARMAAKFREKGGGKYIPFSARNVECQLVEMGLETMYVDGNSGIRGRTRVNERRPSTGEADAQTSLPGAHPAQFYHGPGRPLTESQRELLHQQAERRELEDDNAALMNGVIKDEDDVPIKEEGRNDMGLLQQVPRNLGNGHIGHFQVGQDNGSDL